MARPTGAVRMALAALVLAMGCATANEPAAEAPSALRNFTETFDEPPEWISERTVEGLTTAVENGAYRVVLRDPETSHRTNLPIRSASGLSLVSVEADFLTGIEGPLYGINCWTRRDGSGFLGLIQVTDGVAEGGIAYEDAAGDWEALEKVGGGPSARIGDVHTLRMDCAHLADGATVVLRVNGKPLAAYEGDAARTGGGWSLYMHFAGTPIGGVAAITVQEIRINPQD